MDDAPQGSPTPPALMLFDVFGTLVDWAGSVACEVEALAPGVDGLAFARDWRAGYDPAMAPVRDGRRGYVRLDVLHREMLEPVLAAHGLDHLDAATRDHLSLVWHRLDPWPDVAAGLQRLRQVTRIAPLSNGNLSLLADLARRGHMPWDCVLSTEIWQQYKPHPATYLGAADCFGLDPDQVMLVAAHHDDLAAARALGLRSAYIERPFEFGNDRPKDVSPVADNELHVQELLALAACFGV